MNWNAPEVFAVKHKDLHTRMESRSGGIFTALSDKILKEDGAVYGCVLTDNFEAIHIRSVKHEDRNRMRGSKYIQSSMGDVFCEVLKDLKADKMVLFSGTSCQIAGLKGYLKKEYTNLICVDLVCHGVPSPMVWKAYLKWQERKKMTCVGVDFRNKREFGWRASIESLFMQDKKGNMKRIDSNVFGKLFYGHSIIRPCCYKCPYKSVMHPGDITIADYWGVDKAAPEFNDNKGVSLVLINNERALELFNRIKEEIEWKQTKLEDSMQPPLINPFEKPPEREQFWMDFPKYNFSKIVRKYTEYNRLYFLKKMLKRVILRV